LSIVPVRRSFFITLLLVLAVVLAHAQDTLDLTRFKWGTPLSVMQDRFALKSLKEQGSTARYSSNVLSIGEALLDDCQFEFTDGRFSGIAATTPGERDSEKLLQWLESRFGPGESREPLGWQWLSGDTHIWFDVARAGDGYLYWYSLRLQPAKEKR
jgi:hypothetical protein